mmetsp:Transcript_34915/g.62781  ORF Transcript_34915/g.62781 Transcript_34915/m.62781 type:complete len:152 (-) Transcript_34915:276-731(-)|eukprot:CAMPEP_0175079400 /NCGR_PEP_ID=MMETSP0052_2-20121109/24797_1 /TAXON_ID=51329 ORGANISM="Polytomella parva, Strain SAG 63-3" /NCGR_SAMPLE_ID=MMETSP0052_2 /ASSEMBLY_ACC=CAM_ASM_000194 /LENGTH=151 /DNA_ID=CAMNT_0016349717 /DNA_START=32 /DNA_END=487 /DNA_ORIENTATION=+
MSTLSSHVSKTLPGKHPRREALSSLSNKVSKVGSASVGLRSSSSASYVVKTPVWSASASEIVSHRRKLHLLFDVLEPAYIEPASDLHLKPSTSTRFSKLSYQATLRAVIPFQTQANNVDVDLEQEELQEATAQQCKNLADHQTALRYLLLD